MSLLYYTSLSGVGLWNDALFSTGRQLQPYAAHLRAAIQAMKDASPVLAWREPTGAELRVFDGRMHARHEQALRRAADGRRRRDRHAPMLPDGVWIVLEPPPDRPEEPEDTFDSFLEARSLHDEPQCGRESSIDVNDCDREGRALRLSRRPVQFPPAHDPDPDKVDSPAPTPSPLLWLRPNTHPLQCQLNALRALENRPTPRLTPLIRLLAPEARWEPVEPRVLEESDWLLLTNPERDGTTEQREFVARALGTPDFALLEGPPGSGKTTAICELIAQLTREGKRVLLVASTHVAVDNVLERLLAWQERAQDRPLLPLRIGDEQRASAAIKSWIYKHILRTWADELLDFLDRPENADPAARPARALLKEALTTRKQEESSTLARLLLESSNLVCGTTIGILQHPEIKAAHSAPIQPFDVMILDEASKTTFTEFLVPALHARRWIVVGDIKQLSPYVEEIDITASIRALVPPAEARATVHAFFASNRNPMGSLVAVADDLDRKLLVREAEARDVPWVDLDQQEPATLHNVPDALSGLLYSRLVFGTPEALRVYERRLPGDLRATGGPLPQLRRWEAHRSALGTEREEVDWGSELAWRLIRSYELRLNRAESGHLEGAIEELLPHRDDESRGLLRRNLATIRRVTMPSILELLQRGFERIHDQRSSVALTDGLPGLVLAQRHVALKYQHRMHPDISRFPREQFYTSKDGAGLDVVLLSDSTDMARDRQWNYPRYSRRATWIHVDEPQRGSRRPGNVNLNEVDRVVEELKVFVAWSRQNPRPDRRPWEVAVLTFYRGQEAELRGRLQALFCQHGNFHNFNDGEWTRVELCTVDRFQGHEADLVFLSFVKTRAVGFLNSPNRLNVGLTRARYQIVLIGHHAYFDSDRCRSDLLRALAKSSHYAHEITWSAT